MKKNTKLAKLTAFLVALVMLLGSFPGRYNVTIAYSEDGTNVTETSELSEEEQEAVRKAAEEEAARIAEEEAAQKAAEEEAARKAAEEEAARKAAEEEAARKAAEEEAARKAAEEEAARKAAEEEAARKAAEEEAARKAAEEEAARKAAEEAARQEEVSEQIGGDPAPEMDQPETSADDDFDDFEEFDDFDDFDEFEDDEDDEDYDDDDTIILDDWDAGVVSTELLERFNSTSNYEQMEFNGTADIELKNEGMLRYGDEIKLEAKVRDVNLSYRLIWEANDNDDRGWYTIASGERYSYTLTADNLAREYRVVLFSLD